jgi:hypothetical protein
MIQYHIKKSLLLGVACLGLLSVSGCGSPKRYAYMQDVELAKRYSVDYEHKLVVEPGDRIRVAVQSDYPELVAPFNGLGFQTSMPGVPASSSSSVNSSSSQEMRGFGYTVNEKGEINFPVLGWVKVSGLTLEGVSRHLEEQIKKSKYLTDPRVETIFANFQIYMLGALNGVGNGSTSGSIYNGNQNAAFTAINSIGGGVLRISDKRELSILEALAYMGDLPINANIEKVMIIRRINGQFVTYRLNMKSTDIYTSPAFYLKQNDIVYVEPLYRRDDFEGVQRVFQAFGYVTTTITSVVALIALLRR